MRIKLAIVLVAFSVLTTGESSLKNTKGAIDDIAQSLLSANGRISQSLADANQAISDIQTEVDDLRERVKARAAELIAQAKEDIDARLDDLRQQANGDADKLLGCLVGQQDGFEGAALTASNAIADSVAGNLNGIGDSIVPLIRALRKSNGDLNKLENELVACEDEEDDNGCAVDLLIEIARTVVNVPTDVEGGVDAALEELRVAGQNIVRDVAHAIDNLNQNNLQILDAVVDCTLA